MDTPPFVEENTPTLESVTKQFEAWRANRQKRDRIPLHLWQAAAQLCKDHPTTLVCRCLRLSFTDLKKHLHAEKNDLPVQFMKIDFSGAIGNWQLCCRRSDGTQLSFAASGALPDIDQLLEKFLS
jgi:hypothetical protein